MLKEATGAPRVVPVASIEDQKPGGSLMPKGLANLMTHAEFVDLVRFLSELGKPGPYAIRTIPTIQRWRVLKPVSPALATAIPDKDLFRDQVLKAEPGRWTTAYARVAGSLPLDELTSQTGRKSSLPPGRDQRLERRSDPHSARFASRSPVLGRRRAGAGRRDRSLSAHSPPAAIRSRSVSIPRRGPPHEIKVEVTKPSGSPAEFTVVGGH